MKTAMMMNPTTKSITFVLLCIATLLLLSAASANAELLRSRQIGDEKAEIEEEGTGSVLLPPELIDTMVGKALVDEGLSMKDFFKGAKLINDGLPEGVDLNDYNLTFIDQVTGEEIQDHRHLVSVSEVEWNNARFVNRERRNLTKPVPRLVWSIDAIIEAQKWSRYMCTSGDFQHRSNLAQGITGDWRRISENIAMNMQVTYGGAHTALMNSAGHRANIVDEKVNQFGIGICKASSGWNYVTHIFTQIA